MNGNDRITQERATAIVIQDFCEKMGIPLLITGHTAHNRHVELYVYSDFDSIDRLNRYRLMDLRARQCNRDGVALRFTAEKLSRRSSEKKLLIVVSDGMPYDSGYTGSLAEADLRSVKQEYERKGVRILAAAIGDDREKIERIYQSGFLDISNVAKLPCLLAGIIARSVI